MVTRDAVGAVAVSLTKGSELCAVAVGGPASAAETRAMSATAPAVPAEARAPATPAMPALAMSATASAVPREARAMSAEEQRVWALASTVCDPEVPVLTVEDLGVLRRVTVDRDAAGARVTVAITPTYSGCPAVDAIREDIGAVLRDAGYDRVTVETVLSPAWTTDWMSGEGRAKLERFGIAPPVRRGDGVVSLGLGIRCPHCGSLHTRELSRFGSTSCKALYVCQRCEEPFDYFKAH